VVGTSQNSGFLDSGVQTGSGTYEATFDEPGTYEYQCGIHGTAMSARVTVS
jgi:plastocyanin